MRLKAEFPPKVIPSSKSIGVAVEDKNKKERPVLIANNIRPELQQHNRISSVSTLNLTQSTIMTDMNAMKQSINRRRRKLSRSKS